MGELLAKRREGHFPVREMRDMGNLAETEEANNLDRSWRYRVSREGIGRPVPGGGQCGGREQQPFINRQCNIPVSPKLAFVILSKTGGMKAETYGEVRPLSSMCVPAKPRLHSPPVYMPCTSQELGEGVLTH